MQPLKIVLVLLSASVERFSDFFIDIINLCLAKQFWPQGDVHASGHFMPAWFNAKHKCCRQNRNILYMI